MKQFILMATLLAAQGAWAQSDTDLPALPPGMESSPVVELPPPPEMPPALPAAEQTAPAPVVTQTPPAVVVERPATSEQAPTATAVFEPGTEVNQGPVAQEVAGQSPLSATPLPEGAAVKEDFKPSYGEFDQSLLFSREDIDRMKKLLFMYERVKRPEAGTILPAQDDFAKLIETPVIPTVSEPPSYPSFYLSSIVYRSPRDWLFWMNGTKYSPKTMPGYMELVSINPRQVTLTWKPEYIASAHMRYESKNFDTTMPQHLRSRMSQVRWDKEKESFLVTLSPNQSFVSAAFGVFEGKYADRSVPEMQQAVQVEEILNEPSPLPTQGFNDPDAALKATMRDLQKVNSNLTQLAPRNNPNASTSGNGADAAAPADGSAPPADPMASTLPTIERAM